MNAIEDEEGHFDIVKFLVEQGAVVNVIDNVSYEMLMGCLSSPLSTMYCTISKWPSFHSIIRAMSTSHRIIQHKSLHNFSMIPPYYHTNIFILNGLLFIVCVLSAYRMDVLN